MTTASAASSESHPAAHGGLIGKPIRRREDAALLTGAGRYVDDLTLPGMVYLGFVRSPHPRARIASIDTAAARAAAGVVAVYTGDDLAELNSLPTNRVAPGMAVPPHPPLARDEVHAVGAPVAVVAAETRAQAEDAAALIEVDYEVLESVASAEAALAADAVVIHAGLSSNLCYRVQRGSGDVAAAFDQADRIVSARLESPRLQSVALEPRGVLAQADPYGGGLTVWLSTQSPHRVRADLAATLDMPEAQIRIIAPDVGGGFGTKGSMYREDVVAAFVARQLGQPAKWVATRSEDFLTTMQGRGLTIYADLALKHDGTMLGLKVRGLADLGAYLNSGTPGPPQRLLAMSAGCYQIRNVDVVIEAAFTDAVPTGPYRGAGRPESVLLIEVLTSLAARELNLDPVEIRRRNLIGADQFPYRTATGITYDSGDYARTLDRMLAVADYAGLVRDRDTRRARGELVGIGLSTFVEPSGGAGFESGTVRIDRTGTVTVLTGSSSHGQGHHTVWAQIVADKLGVPMDQVVVHHGDSQLMPQGTGTFGSRSAIMGGGALAVASDQLVAKAKRIAAHLLEASAEDVEQRDHGFGVIGAPDRAVAWADIAGAAYRTLNLPTGEDPGLEVTHFMRPRGEAYGFGSHLAVVSVDRESGRLRLEKLVMVDDCGVILNPMIVEGQVVGGLAQGLGQALMEALVYDPSGQLLSGSLLDYAVPRATDMPDARALAMDHTVTPSPNNPLGVKGVGEAGTIGAPPAILNAVLDALQPVGVRTLDMPLSAERLWQAIGGQA